jgi:hypothetical protein
MREQLLSRRPITYLRLARNLLMDPDDTCRWQSAIVIGEYIQTEPVLVWSIVRELADVDDEDLRTALATVLLELWRSITLRKCSKWLSAKCNAAGVA